MFGKYGININVININVINNDFIIIPLFVLERTQLFSYFTGGRYTRYTGMEDGLKYVCLDDFPDPTKSSSSSSCLIYSFGVRDDVTFEAGLPGLGNVETARSTLYIDIP